MHNDRLYFSSQVLNNGKVYVAGGESGTGGNNSETYDPVTNTWSNPVSTVGLSGYIADGNSEILPSGKILQAIVGGGGYMTNIYNPITNTYSVGPEVTGTHDESAWLTLPDSSILFVDIFSTTSERYIPSSNEWIADATVPVSLYDSFTFECGDATILPNGKGIFFGSTPYAAIYTPSNSTTPGTWTSISLPNNMGQPDGAIAMMNNGKVLCAFSPTPNHSYYPDSIFFYEFDYNTNSFAAVNAPDGSSFIHSQAYMTSMLDLPDGNVLFSLEGSKQYLLYTPGGTQLTSSKPTTSGVYKINCDTFMITGAMFTGISKGASYGDDGQMSTNYPIIQLKYGTNVYYAKSFGWNRYGSIMTGSASDTTMFTVPSIAPHSNCNLSVIVNGNQSNPTSFNNKFMRRRFYKRRLRYVVCI